MAIAVNELVVLIVTAEGGHRETLLKVLQTEGYEAYFVSSIDLVKEYVAAHEPAVLLHDWSVTDPTQAQKFQQSLAKVDDYADICRVIYAPAITPELMAFAADCGIRRVISYSTTILNLVLEIKMAMAAGKNLNDLQRLIRRTHIAGEYRQDDIDRAVEDAYDRFPHDPVVRIEYGNLRHRLGDSRQPRQLANLVLQDYPQNVRAMNLLARIAMKEGNFDEAQRVLENANGLSPFNTDRLVMLGDVFFKKGDLPRAKSFFGEAMALEPENRGARRGMGEVLLSEGDANAAVDFLKNSASEEEAAGLFNNAAVHAARSARLEESLRLYQLALQVLHTDKLKPSIYFNVALALDRLSMYEEAMKCIRRCLKYDPRHQKALREKSRLEAIALRDKSGGAKSKGTKKARAADDVPPTPDDYEVIGGETPKKSA